jgi:hypothetical protein
VENLSFQKNPLQDLLSSYFSQSEHSIYNRSRGLFLNLIDDKHPLMLSIALLPRQKLGMSLVKKWFDNRSKQILF